MFHTEQSLSDLLTTVLSGDRLSHCLTKFRAQKIETVDTLAKLNSCHLEQLGLELGLRIEIMDVIKRLQENANTNASDDDSIQNFHQFVSEVSK